MTDEGMVLTEKTALLVFLLGFVCVVIFQGVFTAIFSVGWRVWMSRAV